jgi:acetyl-CoA decarbonylase/synthase complex subunit delta
MAFKEPVEKYSNSVVEVDISGVKIGGQSVLSGLYTFDGPVPNPPKIAMEVLDTQPEEWPKTLVDALGDVYGDPVKWALKCQNEYKADMICLSLLSTDPNGINKSAADAAKTAKGVLDAINVPLIVYGSLNSEKDGEVMKAVAEACHGKALVVGPADDENYRTIGASSLGYGSKVAAQTPIDVNLAKQLNILLGNLGVPMESIILDPTTGGLGYGIEYSFSVMQRIRLAALAQGDDKLKSPMINMIGKEAWKAREAKISAEEEPNFGDLKTRGILWEAITAINLLVTGSDILILRHPESVRLVREFMKGF